MPPHFGLGPRVCARVVSPRRPVLRPGAHVMRIRFEPQGLEEGIVVAAVGEHPGPVVPAVDRAGDQPIIGKARAACHAPQDTASRRTRPKI